MTTSNLLLLVFLIALPSSSGSDTSLSRRRREFDSRWEHLGRYTGMYFTYPRWFDFNGIPVKIDAPNVMPMIWRDDKWDYYYEGLVYFPPKEITEEEAKMRFPFVFPTPPKAEGDV